MTAPSPSARAQALGTQLFLSSLAAAELMTMYLGVQLGLYDVLADGPVTPGELAGRAGIAERYATEWLEQQAAAGIVDVHDAGVSADCRRFLLPPGHQLALTDRTSPFYIAPLTVLPIGGIAPVLPQLMEAMRLGDGVPYDAYGEPMRAAQSDMNRPVFEHQLAQWIRAAMPDVHQTLRRPGAAIADIGCGTGTSSLVLARTYPSAQVHGFDADAEAIAAARAVVPASADRVRFEVRDMAGLDAAVKPDLGRYDLVCVFDALHDMSRPVDVLRACRALLRPGGSVMLMEPKAGEKFVAPASEVERFIYTVSVLHCLPVGMIEQPSAGTGAVLRPDTLRRYASAAGFTRTTVLDVDHRFHRLYRLD